MLDAEELKDSLEDNGTQGCTLTEENKIQKHLGAAAWEPTQLHLVDKWQELALLETPRVKHS